MRKGKIYGLLLLIAVSSGTTCYGQSPPGINEIYQVSGSMHGYYFAFSDLSLVLGAIVGLLGGIRVFANWQAGRHHIDAQVTAWFFSCLFLLLTGVFLRGLFSL